MTKRIWQLSWLGRSAAAVGSNVGLENVSACLGESRRGVGRGRAIQLIDFKESKFHITPYDPEVGPLNRLGVTVGVSRSR